MKSNANHNPNHSANYNPGNNNNHSNNNASGNAHSNATSNNNNNLVNNGNRGDGSNSNASPTLQQIEAVTFDSISDNPQTMWNAFVAARQGWRESEFNWRTLMRDTLSGCMRRVARTVNGETSEYYGIVKPGPDMFTTHVLLQLPISGDMLLSLIFLQNGVNYVWMYFPENGQLDLNNVSPLKWMKVPVRQGSNITEV